MVETLSVQELIKGRDINDLIDVVDWLSRFTCARSVEVQDFLHKKAIDFDIKHLARTYICFDENGACGYFTLTIKGIKINPNIQISKSLLKKLSAGNADVTYVSAYLVAQLGKFDNYVGSATGADLLELANEILLKANHEVGGRVVYVECKDEPKLTAFYERMGFRYLQRNPENQLNQMVRLISQ